MPARNREEWLTLLAERLNVFLFEKKMPANYRVACSWPCRGAKPSRNRVIGLHYDPSASKDKTHEIIISMALDDPMQVAATLAHEMVHAIVGNECGHRGPFKALAQKIGLVGKMTATIAGPSFKKKVQLILERIGDYPHAELRLPSVAAAKKGNKTIKTECPECGYTAKTNSYWIEQAGTPLCPTDKKPMALI